MKYIIMCAGYYPEHNIPRQLWTFNGEKILDRTVRLLENAGIFDIAVYYSDPLFESTGYPLIKQKKEHVTWKDFADIFPELDEPACYIFGDVFFSPAAIRKIVETETDDVEFFASQKPFQYGYMKPWEEPFAFKVVNQEHFRKACKEAEELYRQKILTRASAWELWQVIKGTSYNNIIYDYTAVNDYTCDIDKPSDLEDLRYCLREMDI